MSKDIKLRKGVTSDESVVAEVLREGEVLHLALKDSEGIYSVPVNYGFKPGAIYIHSFKSGRKISALILGEEVGFSVVASHKLQSAEKPCKWGCAFRSVIGCGVPRLLEDHEKAAALNLIMEQYSGKKWDIDNDATRAVEVVEIMITTATARLVDRE
ncbi:pyridoxamine 5'-phosphate oxidase family protein [Maridesulfovibrio ferrireducens]|uniref:pyridoxamine 5'-phosphate oxidase family protein n=1 Tax=Maridesulfovibrio ferrireducens TaxID=246191 RepID=UPI001A1F4B96|nr:pyridoxamine 5'-phosphate oxidase family protein [Maridesulfovibrio ferrireducens]MBI9112287.1 pyridoxamine 5'-phosphate oxidase family protein [Maridesulfovibrio ferrireducens]